MRRLCFILLLLLWPCLVHAQESMNDLPLPRWATLASREVNLRLGPGERYPIDWVIKQQGLPVEIQKEFENWRKIKLHDGTTGWVHRVMLSGARHALVNAESQLLYRQPQTDAHVEAKVTRNVVGNIKKCTPTWCFLDVQGFDGWAPKTVLWGVYDHETWE